MCGRFTITAPANQLAGLLGVPDLPDLTPRYNVAPSQRVLAARLDAKGRREAAYLGWGLIPSWAGDVKIAHQLINARAETLAEKPSFRDAFQKRRCLIPADGFFEWLREGKRKRPHRFRRPDGGPFLLAGLWERRERPGEEPRETCTVVTTAANGLVRPFHDRMPAILTPELAERWLTPRPLKPDEAAELLAPVPDDFLIAEPVSDAVNSPRVDDARCVEPPRPAGLFDSMA